MLARERVLTIMEILENIFCHLLPGDLASCARVCHGWEITSLGLLWSVLQDPRPLFKLLGELDSEDNTVVVSSMPPSPRLCESFELIPSIVI